MVRIGNYQDQFSQTPTPKTNPNSTIVIASGDGSVYTGPFIMTDSVGKGYADATPLQVPPGSSSGAVLGRTSGVFVELQARHNNPAGPMESSTGTVQMGFTSISGSVIGIYEPVIEFTPPQVQP